ncbi:nucleotide-sugar transporter-domain-containing protein [Hyaloraphidium curvatum]|nr:nucleotide-sugar transporter-domain-containing protein [Hyaloraphidium curvatum]
MGIQLKWISLLTLVVQNSTLVLVMRYSRMIPGPRYLASTAVVLSEVTKFLISLAIYVREEQDQHRFSVRKLYNDIFGPESDWYKLMVPAILYFIQNNLQYIAVTLLDAATFQVTYQMKILTTALFTVFILNRSLSRLKWISLVFLTAGIALVQLPSGADAKASDLQVSEKLLGLLAVTIACLLSGLAGVYFEKILKGTSASLWVRNVQLALFSFVPGYLFGVLWMDGDSVRENGFFHGYNAWAYGAIACQAFGGLIVALVVKYADNILKGFATSISIILSSVASVFLFDFHITLTFLLGSSLVIYATYLYGLPDQPQSVTPKELQYVRVEMRPEVEDREDVEHKGLKH